MHLDFHFYQKKNYMQTILVQHIKEPVAFKNKEVVHSEHSSKKVSYECIKYIFVLVLECFTKHWLNVDSAT